MQIIESNSIFNVPDYTKVTSKNEVFYNPIMSFNRDISLLAVNRESRDSSILCGMAGTGVRAIRYSLMGFQDVTANDINPKANQLTSQNASLNKVELNCTNLDFNLVTGKYGIVDIDPFGSPVRYIHSAFRLLRKEGSIFITATDTAALCGSSKRACIRKYSAYPMLLPYCHEIGLRIMIGYIVRQAASWDYGCLPQISFYKDHYMRVHMKFIKGKRRADKSMDELGFLYHCDHCLNRFFSKRAKCDCDCGHKLRAAYPIWGDSICDKSFIHDMIDDIDVVPLHDREKVLSFLSILKDEVDVPYFWDSHEVFSSFKMQVPTMEKIMDTLLGGGYEVSKTHFKPTGFKTDANMSEMFQIFSSK